MNFFKVIGLVLIALVLGAMAVAAMPFLYIIGVGLCVILVGYILYTLKDFDPDEHFPFNDRE